MLTWWGHTAHDQVDDAIVERVHAAVLGGVGLLALHSAHYSKIFQRLLGTSCSLRWRNDGERELVWTVDPAHPIAAGVPHPIVIDAHEMYGEHFDIPAARRARLRQLVRRRRGVPRRLLLSPRGRADLLLQPGRPGLPDLPPPRRAAGHRERGRVGRAGSGRPARRSREPDGAARLVSVTGPSRQPLRVGVVGVGWAGQQHLAAYDAHPDTTVAALAGLEDRPRAKLAARYGIEHAVAEWKDLLDGRGPRRRQRLRPDVPARADRDRGARARPPRAVREADRARRGRGAAHGQGRPQGRPRARRRLQPPPARRHPEAQGADRRGPARPPVLRQGVVAAAHRHPHASAAGSRAASSRAAARWSTSASTCSTGRSSSSVTRRSSRSAPRPTTCWPPTASAPALPGATRARPVRATARRRSSTSRTSRRSSCGWHDGGTLLVEASWAAHRRDGDEFGITMYGTDAGAELIVDNYAPKGDLQVFTDDGGEAVATRVPVKRGRAHKAVIEQFVDKIRAGDWRRYDGRAPPRSPASSTPATCRPRSSARSGSIPDATAPAARGWVSGGAAPVASRRRPPRGRRSPSSRRRRTSPRPR